MTKDYYRVSGSTAREIRNDLDRKTPVNEKGKKYDAYTTWLVHWKYHWNASEDQCRITQVSTTVDVQYILPKLKRSAPLPKALVNKWERYLRALLQHENGHKDIGVRAANEIEEKIRNMKPRRTCQQLELDANRLGHKVLDKYLIIEDEFDRTTNHGGNDGAIFP
ncbi:MAG: DUF922 domain-containing protein [Candidatus Electrothrix sp. GW3-4]|uniref:DUF922 domain-containing Zn-dependent protease n=1 Tax=Candidatus Electrothrix sp. GW3-4 TaxID=3126740 RepID=UPI0030CC5D92